jgi:AcrR family transcriptional regulator
MKKENQSEKIIKAAIKLISIKGYSNVSLRDISNEAGVALSQLHYYFKSKEGILLEVIEYIKKIFILDLNNLLVSELSPKDNLNNLIHYFEEKVDKTPEYMKLLLDLSSMALWSDSFKQLVDSLYQDVTDLINEYISKGTDNSKAVANMIFGSIIGSAMQFFMNPRSKKIKFEQVNLLIK